MASLVDLFNPTFLMFLGVLVLVVAGLVVYFESKLREQNLRIASMLSLMSTLVEDVNGVKFGVHQLTTGGGVRASLEKVAEKVAENEQAYTVDRENVGNPVLKNLIEVSDDDYDEDEYEDEDENVENVKENGDVDDSELEEVTDDDDSVHSNGDCDVKIITIHNFASPSTDEEDVSTDEDVSADLYEEANQMEFDPVDDLNEFLMNNNDEVPEITDDYVEQVLDLKYDETVNEIANEVANEVANEDTNEVANEDTNVDNNLDTCAVLSANDLKTISINAADEQEPDYRKIQLSKLKSIVIEKGLATASEASKLKKPDILKLLGIE